MSYASGQIITLLNLNFPNIMNITWRPYQQEIMLADKDAERRGVHRRLIVSATGTGKRLMAVGISRNYKRTLFLCHRIELIEQAYEDFERMFPLEVGIVKGKRFEINKRIVIASVQTIYRRLDKIPEDYFDCVMADEVHHYVAPTYILPLKHFKCKTSYGFTATPTRLDGLDFGNIMDEIIYNYSLERGIKEGYLCQLDALRIRTNVDLGKIKKIGGDFAIGELSSAVDIPERNALVVQKYIRYAFKRQAIVFCVDIKHAMNVCDEFNKQFKKLDFDLKAAVIHSKLDPDTRREISRDFKNGTVEVIVNVNILTEGFDHDDVGAILQVRPTQSLALYMQMIGRGTRLKSEKYKEKFMLASCKIIDFVDNVGSHKLINTWELDKNKKEEDKVFITEEKREELLSNREGINQQRIARIKYFYDKDKPIDLFKMPKQKRAKSSAHWYDDKATYKQVQFLKSLGIYEEGIDYTKGQAYNAINGEPINHTMRCRLAEWGYKVIDLNTGKDIPLTVSQWYDIFQKRKVKQAQKP